ncbi:hypothetical protein XENOCAPTIV_015158, partial [Xenoophorus captivus]
YVFVSFLSRDNTYKFLTSVCLDLESTFGDLDGAMRQRRQEMEENSSSDSQTPDYDKITDLPIPHFLDALKQKGNTSSPEQQHKVKKQHLNQQSSNNKQHTSNRSSSEVVIDSRVMKSVPLNTLLIIYMFL